MRSYRFTRPNSLKWKSALVHDYVRTCQQERSFIASYCDRSSFVFVYLIVYCFKVVGVGGHLFEAGRLSTFLAFQVGRLLEVGIVRGWVLIRINTVFGNPEPDLGM